MFSVYLRHLGASLPVLLIPLSGGAQAPLEIGKPTVLPLAIEAVLLHPPFKGVYYCAEHDVSEPLRLGDALGKDCVKAQPMSGAMPDAPAVLYRGAGTKNEDWFTWGAEVLAPSDARVEFVYKSTTVNRVGQGADEPPSMILFVRDDGLRIVFAHLKSLTVREGDLVKRGQFVGTAGNNGRSRNPHLHVGVWRGLVPLQIRFDQTVPRSAATP